MIINHSKPINLLYDNIINAIKIIFENYITKQKIGQVVIIFGTTHINVQTLKTESEEKGMFIKTIKVKKPTFAVIGAVLAALALLAVIIVTVVRISSPAVYEMKSEAQRQAFLKEMGWEVSDEYDECKAVTIPKEFNEVYEKYNKLQKQQGFDLEDYKGKTAEVYTYAVKNYGNKKQEVRANLIVCEGQLVGGDVCSAELDGFMQGLRKK